MQEDKLDVIFRMQNAFDTELAEKRPQLKEIAAETWIQKETLAMLGELAELLDEVNFKWWKNPKPVDKLRIKQELVDILHFFVSMCLKMDMTSQELHDMYLFKNKENFDRQNGQSEREGYCATE